MSSILVTGAGGLIGSRVVHAARQAGHTVTRVLHQAEPAEDAVACDLRRRIADLPPPDWVFHLAGGYAGAGRRALRRIDLRMAKNLARWGVRSGVKNWVFASAAEVYGDLDALAAEDAPTRPVIPYGEVKLEAEQLFAAMAQDIPDCRVVILRIGEVYGRGSKLLREITGRLARGFCPWPGMGRVPVSFVHVDNVARAFVLAAGHARAGVSIYNVADSAPTTWRDFLRHIAAKLGARPPVFLPRALASGYVLGHRLACCLTGRAPTLTRNAVRLLTTPKPLSADKIAREMGFAPLYANHRAGLEEALGLPHDAEDGAAQGSPARTPA